MSLINQMLKDLEQRGANSTDVQPSIIPQFGAVTKKSNSRRIGSIGLILIILAFGYTLFSVLDQQNNFKDLLGLNKNDEINTTSEKRAEIQTISAQPAKFGQAIEDKGITNEALPDTPIMSANDEIELGLSTKTQQLAQPNSLFETSLKYNVENNSEQQANTTATTTKKKPTQPVVESEKKTTALIESSEPAKREVATDTNSKLSTSPSVATKHVANINKRISPEQNANSYYQQALIYLQQGRVAESQANLAKALEFNPAHHEARLTLASLLLDNKRLNDAKEVLNAGLQISPEQNEFRIALARLQINAGDQTTALNTLEQGLQYATNQADYQAFLATLLQRSGRHEEAVNHYMKAVSLETNAGGVKTNTLVGLGISLQTVGKLESAQQAFIKAQQTGALSPALSSFVDQQLKKINQSIAK